MPRRGENIYHRKDGRWEGRYIKTYSANKKAIYGYVYANTYSEAKQKLISARNSAPSSDETFSEFSFNQIVIYWLNKKRNSVKTSTITRYETKIYNHIMPIFADYKIGEITTLMLENFVFSLSTKGNTRSNTTFSSKTIADTIAILKSILRYAEQFECVLHCNLDCLKIKTETRETKVLTREEQIQVNNQLSQSDDYTSIGILLSLYTGIRIGEVCSLTIDDIDFSISKMHIWRTLQRVPDRTSQTTKTKLIFTEPKTKKSKRDIPLPYFVTERIKDKKYSTGCFLLSGTPIPVEPRTLENRYNKFMKELNISDTTFHTLRHTFATRCVEAQFDIKTLSDLLGHSSVNITLNRYVHSSYELKEENMKKIEFSL